MNTEFLKLLETLDELNEDTKKPIDDIELYYSELEVSYDSGRTCGNGWDEPEEAISNETTVEYIYSVDAYDVAEIIIDNMSEEDFNKLLAEHNNDEDEVSDFIAAIAQEYLADHPEVEKIVLDYFEESARESWEENNWGSYEDDLYNSYLEDQYE
jgi:hypothetical protein